MGQRANLVLVENGQYTLFYNHWCANMLPRDIFWGPEHAVRFIRVQRKLDPSDWLDEVWAEGAALVDLDRRILLLFGGEDLLCDVPMRREYLELLQRLWEPWQVQWVTEGIAEIVEYVGVPRAKVLRAISESPLCSLAAPDEVGWSDTVGSIRWSSDQLAIYPLQCEVETYLYSGPDLLAAPETGFGLQQFGPVEWGEAFPGGGFHVDVPDKTVEFWTARSYPEILSRVSAHWPTWKVIWHKDAFEFQADRMNGRLVFPTRPKELLQNLVTDMLLSGLGSNGAEKFQNVVELLRAGAEGEKVEINPYALRDDRLELSLERRKQIIADARQSGE